MIPPDARVVLRRSWAWIVRREWEGSLVVTEGEFGGEFRREFGGEFRREFGGNDGVSRGTAESAGERRSRQENGEVSRGTVKGALVAPQPCLAAF